MKYLSSEHSWDHYRLFRRVLRCICVYTIWLKQTRIRNFKSSILTFHRAKVSHFSMSFNVSHFTHGTNRWLTGGDIFDTFQADKTIIIIIMPAERLKASPNTHSIAIWKKWILTYRTRVPVPLPQLSFQEYGIHSISLKFLYRPSRAPCLLVSDIQAWRLYLPFSLI